MSFEVIKSPVKPEFLSFSFFWRIGLIRVADWSVRDFFVSDRILAQKLVNIENWRVYKNNSQNQQKNKLVDKLHCLLKKNIYTKDKDSSI